VEWPTSFLLWVHLFFVVDDDDEVP
jgi:hypothetical protein